MEAKTRIVMHSSNTAEWGTPQEFFDRLDKEFHFELDVCAKASNAKCDRYFSPEQDGLSRDWGSDSCWMNPPYSRRKGEGIGAWLKKARQAAAEGAMVVALVPARTDTVAFQDVAFAGAQYVCFVRGRLKFTDENGNPQDPAPFPSAVVVFLPAGASLSRSQAEALESLGTVLKVNDVVDEV